MVNLGYISRNAVLILGLKVILTDRLNAQENASLVLNFLQTQDTSLISSASIYGYCDEIGTKRYNDSLSKERANYIKRAETQQMKDHAEVIICRPNYTQSLNDLKSFKLCINNDTLQVVKNSKFRVKINKEGTTTIYAIGTKASQTLEIKFGQTYYICAYVYVPNASPVQANKVSVPLTGYTPRIETVEPDKGEVESSFLKYTL